ncbi:MAG: DUF3786 domain-containing protein [Chloroflexota bacterium]|nr:DUF3786 domain-containing protein [Chloroflexota bacterium]
MSSQTLNYGYKVAYQLATEQMAKVDIAEQCARSDARCWEVDAAKIVVLEYLNRLHEISLPDVDVSAKDGQPVPIKDKILILHYFTLATGRPLSSKLITYKELPGGMTYLPTFTKRAIKPVVDNFGGEPRRLMDVAKELGGYRADFGDAGVTVNAFPRVPITYVLWRGDEEFPAQGNILFDSTVTDYLTIEDINVLCETIAWRLVKLSKVGGDNPGRR